MLHAVILAGGTGTRFWPLSRAARPKQLLDLVGGRTMIQATIDRLGDLVAADRTWIITNRSLVQPMLSQLPQLDAKKIIGEPCKRDTAPAIGLAALLLLAEDPDATMALMPADHLIQPAVAFQRAIEQAVQLVESNPKTLVTFGIKPAYPAESFGYIERGERIQGATLGPRVPPGTAVFNVARFREKPAKTVAEEYVASGNYYWNSGIFVWKARTILDALAAHEPAMCDHLEVIQNHIGKPEFAEVFDREFTAIRGKSIDFAVMEHYQPVVVIEAPFTWDDVGSWQAMARAVGSDASGNSAVGKHLAIRSSDCIVHTSGEHLVVTLGASDTIVVHTPDATLVADKRQEEAIREVVKTLEERGWREYL
jgi:mannose-1-phosphate guanylyltransferase